MAVKDADVAIVGTGAWGSSALWRLAERGVNAIAFDAQSVPNVYGSSHGHTRLFRVACHEHVDLTPVARRAKELWLDLSADQGADLLHETGVLSIGPEDGRAIRNVRKAVAYAGVDVTTYTIDEVREKFPQHANLGDHYIGIMDHEAGFVRAEASIRAAVAAATARGARLFDRTAVLDVIDDGDAVIVRTGARDFRVGQVILSSGAWMTKMQDVVPLKAVRAPMLWWEAKDAPEEFSLKNFPAFIRHYDDQHTLWGHGSTPEAPVKLGPSFDEHSRMVVDPDQTLRGVRPGVDWATVGSILPWAVPGLQSAPVLAAPCLVTESPDMQFVIGRHPDRSRIVLAGGCSGHGFKHASAVGELLAQIVSGEELFTDIAFMRPDRFR
ncbi:N-methyl-L-tryptophan oxidase [Pseudarthrobacter sp. YAF2]|uniref:N-methyl-L-tryptophan oxidase n=1 Tax=Pseudarthrobacter sp. YAF2 TaxID=3233078 RepID=UPI003F9BD08B